MLPLTFAFPPGIFRITPPRIMKIAFFIQLNSKNEIAPVNISKEEKKKLSHFAEEARDKNIISIHLIFHPQFFICQKNKKSLGKRKKKII